MSPKDEEEFHVARNPFEWLLHAALMVLGAMVALALALQVLAAIWMWVVGIGLVVGGVVIGVRIYLARRTRW